MKHRHIVLALLVASVVLTFAGAASAWQVFIDNTDDAFTTVGSWSRSSAGSEYVGANWAHRAAGTGANRARWTPDLPAAGWYMIYARWVPAGSRATNAKYTLHHVDGDTLVTVDQTRSYGAFELLGCARFAAGKAGYLELSDDANQRVCADAVAFVPAGTAVMVDNTDPAFRVMAGTWTPVTGGGHMGTNAVTHPVTTNGDKVRWEPILPEAGIYEVFARWNTGDGITKNAAYKVHYSGGSTRVAAEQRYNGSRWMSLGIWPFEAGKAVVELFAKESTGTVIADAVMFIKRPGGLVVDNVDPGFNEDSGDWRTSSSGYGKFGSNYAYHEPGDGDFRARYTPNFPSAGHYTVYARWVAKADRTNMQRWKVFYDGGYKQMTHTQRLNGGEWRALGTFPFKAGSSGYVTARDQYSGRAIADAIMFVKVGTSVTVDNVDDGFSQYQWWWDELHQNGFYGKIYVYHEAGNWDHWARWTAHVPESGLYTVWTRWTMLSDRSRTVTYTVGHDNGETPVMVNQRRNGKQWQLLGIYPVSAGTSTHVEVRSRPDGIVTGDACKWIKVADMP